MSQRICISTFLSLLIVLGCGGDRPTGTIEGERRPEQSLNSAAQAQQAAAKGLDTMARAERALRVAIP